MVLQRHNLVPDFVLTCDPQEKVREYFPPVPDPRTSLVFFPGSQPESVARFSPGRRFAAATESGVSDENVLYQSGTVMTSAMDLCLRMGADPIIIVGSDLALKPDRTHVAGSPAGFYGGIPWSCECEGFFGLPVHTSDNYYLYLRQIEARLANAPPRQRVLNATEGGAHIAGFEHVSLREAVYHVANATPAPRDETSRLLCDANEGVSAVD